MSAPVFFAAIAGFFIQSVISYAHEGEPIVGGAPVERVEAIPFIARSMSGANVNCAASIIDAQWLLTASHCRSIGTVLFAGTLDVPGSVEKMITLEIDRKIVHPNAHRVGIGGPMTRDFMLLHLKQPLDFSQSHLRPILLADPEASQRGVDASGVLSTVAGWGYLKEQTHSSTVLQAVQIPVVSQSVANGPEAYDGKVDEAMLAAGYKEGLRDACSGDSGGPLFTYDSVSQANVLIGVVSWGEGCARPDQYGVYSRVSAAYEWIVNTLRDFREDLSPRVLAFRYRVK